MISSGINLVMTVIGFAVSTMFIVFVCTRLICARIQLNASRRSFPAASRSDLSMLERGLHGLEPPAIAKFPTRKYNEAYFSCSEDAQCTVCLADYHEEDTLRILSYCGHSFHAMCIDTWLQRHSTCPVCRISLRECPEKKVSMQPMYSSAVRSRYDMECLDMDSYHCLLANHEPPLRSGDNHSTNPIEEGQVPSENDGVDARGGISILIEATHITKSSVNKPPVESPSNE